jgi:hypothetical protein
MNINNFSETIPDFWDPIIILPTANFHSYALYAKIGTQAELFFSSQNPKYSFVRCSFLEPSYRKEFIERDSLTVPASLQWTLAQKIMVCIFTLGVFALIMLIAKQSYRQANYFVITKPEIQPPVKLKD